MRLVAAAFAILLLGQPAAAQNSQCKVSDTGRTTAQTLDWEAFDQTGGAPGSFRNLANAGCYREALVAYDDWLRNGSGYPDSRARGIGTFHRGQMYAMLGDNESAQILIGRSMREPGPEDPAAEVWNIYVSGVLAWFRQDRQGIRDAIAGLRAFDTDFARRQVGVLSGLRNCARESYRVAMSNRCRE